MYKISFYKDKKGNEPGRNEKIEHYDSKNRTLMDRL